MKLIKAFIQPYEDYEVVSCDLLVVVTEALQKP